MLINVSEKYRKAIINRINNSFNSATIRTYMSLLNPSLELFLKDNLKDIDAEVVFIDTEKDMAGAAMARRRGENALFVFTEKQKTNPYITSCSREIVIPEAIRLRVFDAWCKALEEAL